MNTSHLSSLVIRFCLHQFFHWMSIGIFIPIMTLFFLSRGLNLFQVGICLSIYSGMILLFELPTGGLADQIGRKTVYLISKFISICGVSLFLLLSDTKGIMFVAFGLMGIARSLSSGTIDAWFVDRFKDISPKGDLQKAFAKVGVWIPMGLALGTLVGGGLPMISSRLGWERYTLNLLLMLIAYLWVAIYTIIWIDESGQQFDKRLLNSFQNLPQVLSDAFQYGFRHQTVLLLMAATLFWGIGVVAIESFWQPQVKWILGSEEQSWIFGLLSTGYFAASALGNTLITPICRLFRNRYALVLVVFRITMGFSFFFLAYQTNIWGFAFFYLFLFLQNGLLNSPHQSLFHGLIPSEKRSTLISLESLFMSIGGMASGIGTGWMADNLSIPFAWQIAGLLFGGSSLCYLWFMRIEKKP